MRVLTPLLAASVIQIAVAHPNGRRDVKPKYPFDPSTTKYCSFWYDNDDGSVTCEDVPSTLLISNDNWLRWNPEIAVSCNNFIIGRSYCIETTNEPSIPITPKSSTLPLPSASKSITPPPPTSTKPSNGITTPTPTEVGIVDNCNAFYFVQSGDSCQDIADKNGITIDEFVSWNKGVGGTRCSGLWAENYVCISVIGRPSTPTKPGNGIQTPSPVQPDIIDTCSKFYYIKEGQSCDTIAGENGITVKDLVSWNRKAGPNCSGMWANTYACVSVISNYDFEARNMAGWNVIDGIYSADTKALVAGSSQGGKAIVNAQMNDFIMRAEVILSTQSGNAGLLFRVSNAGRGVDAYQGYYVGISSEKGGSITLGRADNNWNQLSSVKADIQPGKKYIVIVEAAGDNIFVSLNTRSDRRITVRDGTFRFGSCGVRVYQTGATFDNIYIAPMVYDGFEKNMVGWTIVDGGFDGRNGVMTVPKVHTAKTVLSTAFKDFTFDVDVTLTSGDGNAGIIFRASDVHDGADSYRGYYVGIQRTQVTLGRAQNNWTELKNAKMDIQPNKAHHIRVVASGNTLIVYVDDMSHAQITQSDGTFSSGIVGARVYEAGAIYDNFEIVPQQSLGPIS
ncbi:hypothetical protein J3E68DRAFT_448914 [Trichoderma sp. SZMC 28012]